MREVWWQTFILPTQRFLFTYGISRTIKYVRKAFRTRRSICRALKARKVFLILFTDIQNQISLVKSRDRKKIETP